MDANIIKVLERIENAGFKAYIVGGFVRDKLLFRKTNDIDIATNAKTSELSEIFNETNFEIENYGTFKMRTGKYNYDITTFREEKKYSQRKPIEVNYVDNIEIDVLRRDFTLNAIYMDKTGKIYDLVNGINDISNQLIKVVGNPNIKFKEDPLRILRAIRFATILDFQIDDSLINSIKKYKKLLNNISYARRKEELNLILSSKNALKGLDLLKKYDILKYLDINYENIKYVNDLNGMWAQIEFGELYPLSKIEKDTIKKIRTVINYGYIDNKILYQYGLYISLVAGDILGYNKENLNKNYLNLPIKTPEDLAINSQTIIKLLKIKPSKVIKNIKNELIDLILNNKLKNENDILKRYIIDNKERFLYEK